MSRQASDFCTAFHSEQQLFDHFEKFTAGTEKTKLDDAFRNLTNVMNSIPLVKAIGKGNMDVKESEGTLTSLYK